MDAKAVLKAVDAQDAAWLLNRRVKAGDWVLVKGSRGMRMERVLEEFRLLRTGGEG
jgi:UDP-N-acetylmuramyl pentapeptide synthase